MTRKIKTLVGSDSPALHDALHPYADRIELITPTQIEASPALLAQIEIAYGGLNPAQIASATNLRWLQVGGAGVDRLLTPEMAAQDFILTNARGVGAAPITEHMFGMLLQVTRRLAQAWDMQKTQRWDGNGLGDRVGLLWGKTLGLLGVGAIGTHSACVGKAFGMRTVGLAARRRSASRHRDDVHAGDAPGNFSRPVMSMTEHAAADRGDARLSRSLPSSRR